MIVRSKKSNSTPRRRKYYRGISCFSRRSGILSFCPGPIKAKKEKNLQTKKEHIECVYNRCYTIHDIAYLSHVTDLIRQSGSIERISILLV